MRVIGCSRPVRRAGSPRFTEPGSQVEAKVGECRMESDTASRVNAARAHTPNALHAETTLPAAGAVERVFAVKSMATTAAEKDNHLDE